MQNALSMICEYNTFHLRNAARLFISISCGCESKSAGAHVLNANVYLTPIKSAPATPASQPTNRSRIHLQITHAICYESFLSLSFFFSKKVCTTTNMQ